jgi:hypothetical protein
VQGGGGGAATYDGFTRTHTLATGTADTTMAVTAGVVTLIPLGQVLSSAGSAYTANGANTLFTIPADGVYDISGTVSTNATGWPASSRIGIQVNGVMLARTYVNGGQAYESVTIGLQRYLRTGDQVGLIFTAANTDSQIRILSPANLNDPVQPSLSVWRAGGAQGPAPTIGQTAGSVAIADKTTGTGGVWVDWGTATIPLSSVPVGSTNVNVIGQVTGYFQETSAATGQASQVRVGISFDGGTNYTWGAPVYAGAVGQTSPSLNNREAVAATTSAIGVSTTGNVMIKVQAQSQSAAAIAIGGQISWWLGSAVIGAPATAADLSLTALGIVAMGSTTGASGVAIGAGTIDVSNTISFTPVIGRRYRLVYRMRAISAAGAQVNLAIVGTNIAANDTWRYVAANYQAIETELVFNGTGVASTYKVQLTTNIACTIFNDENIGQFYIEDVGPSVSPPMPIPATQPAWNVFTPTFRNGSTDVSGAFDCRYMRVGRLITAHYAINIISATTGQWNIGLPVPARVPDPGTYPRYWGDTWGTAAYVTNAGGHWVGVVSCQDGNQFYVSNTENPIRPWSNTVPQAAIAGDTIFATISYETTV